MKKLLIVGCLLATSVFALPQTGSFRDSRDGKTYSHSHQEVMERYGAAICMAERVPAALSDDLCDFAYLARFDKKADLETFFKFVTE